MVPQVGQALAQHRGSACQTMQHHFRSSACTVGGLVHMSQLWGASRQPAMLCADSSVRQDRLDSVVSKVGLGTFKGQLQGELATAGECWRLLQACAHALRVPLHEQQLPALAPLHSPCRLPAGSADAQAEVLVIYHYFENPGTCVEDEEVQLMRTNLLYFLRWAARSSCPGPPPSMVCLARPALLAVPAGRPCWLPPKALRKVKDFSGFYSRKWWPDAGVTVLLGVLAARMWCPWCGMAAEASLRR